MSSQCALTRAFCARFPAPGLQKCAILALLVRKFALKCPDLRRGDVTLALLGDVWLQNGVMSTSAERMRRLRERRAAEMEAGEPQVRDADELLVPDVRATIAALKLDGQDAAAAQLALALANAIDVADKPAAALRWLGPSCCGALSRLARPRRPGRGSRSVSRPGRASKLDQMRTVHAQQYGHLPGA